MPQCLMKVFESGYHLARRRVSLHLRRIDQHIRRVMPPRENVQNVPQRRPLR